MTPGASPPEVGGEKTLLSVNVGRPRPNPIKKSRLTGIDKQPVDGYVSVADPGSGGTGLVGLAGDRAYDTKAHGGSDQAVYAYAREDLDKWAAELDRPLAHGAFGENLTTLGLDLDGALIGERWRIGPDVVLEVSCARLPCATFQRWLERDNWIKRFTGAARPGAYLRVIEPGKIRAQDSIELLHRPDHDVSVALVFRAMTLEPVLLPRLLVADALAERDKERIRRRSTRPL
ncbi:MOSC domain-containing protein [Streptomyces sp. AK02-01A]|uniref:MOSC domain-containing protein n=1 Tax=Streptomyces sp. AK02-01A TaxID=3028648 RepID=UPI0029B2D79E|nr:MOSC domain-containing protein [Streptomyces sp. AK02-01A]MDX3855348.1 MOSC domain-containing protein [Streptomyces sp. AK02-01A]